MFISALVLAAVSVLVAVVVGLCAAGRIRRNPIVGLRLPALFASDDAWKSGHRAGVLPTTVAAVICVILAAVVVFVPAFAAVGNCVILAVLVTGVVVATLLGNRAAYRSVESNGV